VRFRFILLWIRSSSEFSCHLSTVRPVRCRNRPFLQLWRPSTASSIRPHFTLRAVRAHHWSALRLFQPLSGFRLDRVPRPYFMPQPFLDCLPSECSPREDRVPLSGPLASLQLSTVLRNAPPATLSPEVSPTPTLLTQSPGSPTNYGSPFHESEGPLPGRPGSPTEGSLQPPASPASKLSSLHESVRTDSSCPEPSGRYSPGRYAPLETKPPRPRIL